MNEMECKRRVDRKKMKGRRKVHKERECTSAVKEARTENHEKKMK